MFTLLKVSRQITRPWVSYFKNDGTRLSRYSNMLISCNLPYGLSFPSIQLNQQPRVYPFDSESKVSWITTTDFTLLAFNNKPPQTA
jgi:hypothetical protein